MEDERPKRAGDEFSVRLTWPKVPERPPEDEEPAAEAEAPPAVPPTAPSPAREPRERSGPALPERTPGATPAKAGRAGRGGARATVRAGSAVRAGTAGAAGSALGPVKPAEPPAPVRRPEPAPTPAAPTARTAEPTPAFEPSPAPTPRHAAAPRSPASASSAVVSAANALPDGSMARAFVDAFDRLSERLLERLRTLRQDIDADLNGLRAEVATLRQAVDDAGQAVQLRQLHSGLDELRGDVAGLRRALLEVPELQRLADEVTAVRGDLSLLFDAAGDGADHSPSAVVGELEQVVARLSEEVGRVGEPAAGGQELGWLVDEVAAIRSDLADLAKRQRATVRLEPDQLRQIADAVTLRLLEELEAGTRRGTRRK